MLRKIAEIKVPKGAGPREAKTNPIFATYDRQGAAFAFFFSDSNIARATANLLFMVDGQKVFVDDGVTLGETNETHTFTYPLPDKLLNYTGKVDGYLYFDFEDGSHSDEIHFVFTIKKSQIDEEMEDAPDVYIKSFEEIKADVQSTADKATSDIKSRVDAVENAKNSTVGDIEKAKDDAESQIGDYVGEVESAKQDISLSASDVQSKANEASEDISNLVKTTEDARDNAESQIGDYVGEVEKDYKEWKEKQEDKQSKFEDDTNERVNKITERVGEAENKASDLESNLDVAQKNYFSVTAWENKDDSVIVSGSIPAIKINLESNNKYTLSTNVPKSGNNDDVFFTTGDKDTVNTTHNGASAGNPRTITTNDDGVAIVAIRDKDMTSGDWWIMLNKGETSARWVPNANDLVTNSELEKIKQAIINLGGSI